MRGFVVVMCCSLALKVVTAAFSSTQKETRVDAEAAEAATEFAEV
jgi:hypothetical protein